MLLCLGNITYLLDVTPSNPLSHHYHLHPFYFVLFTFKVLVAKQHSNTHTHTHTHRKDIWFDDVDIEMVEGEPVPKKPCLEPTRASLVTGNDKRYSDKHSV